MHPSYGDVIEVERFGLDALEENDGGVDEGTGGGGTTISPPSEEGENKGESRHPNQSGAQRGSENVKVHEREGEISEEMGGRHQSNERGGVRRLGMLWDERVLVG